MPRKRKRSTLEMDQPDAHSDDVHIHRVPDELADYDLPDAVLDCIERLMNERDDAIDARKRALADFSNFQRRANENEIRAVQDGTNRVIRVLLPVLDNFDLALQQDPEAVTAQQVLDGVRIVRQELSQALQSLGVSRIAPKRGDAFNPNRHEAMLRQPAPDLGPDSVVDIYQAGYAVGDAVLRPAKVTVSAGKDDDTQAGEGDQQG